MTAAPRLSSTIIEETALLKAEGDWTVAYTEGLEKLAQATFPGVRRLTIDLAGLGHLDTFGAWAIERVRQSANRAGIDAQLLVGDTARGDLFRNIDAAIERRQPPSPPWRASLSDQFEHIGRGVTSVVEVLGLCLDLSGRLALCFVHGLRHPSRLRLRSAIHHLDQVGVRAVPIIALMTFLVGCIIAQQGFFHFQRFGATDYVVDLVTILVLREIGVLLVTIMVAGRSGSAYTAEIGSMKMREEIDALRTMGLDPVEYLVLPRILALMVALPLLTIVGNAAALYGAGIVAWTYGEMTPAVFIQRLHDAASHIDLEVGLIKAPVMAFVIGIVSAVEGLQVRGSAESLGAGTTSSVVRSIFLVIVLDGIFAVLFTAVGM
jgi:phospholipid/cholesterol/gamma-HCH transport system permease protein